MFSKTITAVAVALAASSIVSAQTSTKCNPLKQDCPADPAFGENGGSCDFTKGKCDIFHAMDGTPIKYDSRGAICEMSKAGQAPTLRTDNYIFFGRVDVEMQAAPGKGIVSTIVLLSDDLDEIDFETVGYDNQNIQSNYFSKGDDSTYDRGATHAVNNPLGSSHLYSFEWTPEKVEWFIDGASQRTLKRSDVGAKFPQSPMQVKIGAWVAGYEGNAPGTIKWVGGIADFSSGPTSAIFKSVKIVDYAGGSKATDKDVKEYVYGDRSGSASSIQIKLGNGSVGHVSAGSESATTSSSSSPSSSSKAETSTKTVASSTKSPSTTSSEPTSTASSVKTTMSTASSTVVKSTSSGGTSGTGAVSSTGAVTTTPASTPTVTPNAAPRNAMAVGPLLLGTIIVAFAL